MKKRLCHRCKKVKPLKEFESVTGNYHYKNCQPCRDAYRAMKHRKPRHVNYMKKLYGTF